MYILGISAFIMIVLHVYLKMVKSLLLHKKKDLLEKSMMQDFLITQSIIVDEANISSSKIDNVVLWETFY